MCSIGGMEERERRERDEGKKERIVQRKKGSGRGMVEEIVIPLGSLASNGCLQRPVTATVLNLAQGT